MSWAFENVTLWTQPCYRNKVWLIQETWWISTEWDLMPHSFFIYHQLSEGRASAPFQSKLVESTKLMKISTKLMTVIYITFWPWQLTVYGLCSDFWESIVSVLLPQADAPTLQMDCHPILTNWCHTSAIPPFLRRCLSWHNPPNISWLGTARNMLNCMPSGFKT